MELIDGEPIWIHHDFNCHINEREKSKICLTNHKGSVSHHITSLGINSLRGGHTHKHMLTLQTKTAKNSLKSLMNGIKMELMNGEPMTWLYLWEIGLVHVQHSTKIST